MLLALINRACQTVQCELLFDQDSTTFLEYVLWDVMLTSDVKFYFPLDTPE